MSCGVPQGSVLGPLLFIIYTNDLPNCLKRMKCILFADDTTLYSSASTLNELYKYLNEDLATLADWFKANKLSLNVSKTVYMIFNLPHTIHGSQNHELKLGTEIIKQVDHTKFLGLHLDNELKWMYHIRHVKSKLSSALYALRTAKNLLKAEQMRTIFNSMFRPYIDYGILLWGTASQTLLKSIEIQQKKALRIISNVTYNAHTKPLYKSNNILTVMDTHNLHVSKFMFQLHHNILPSVLSQMFTPNFVFHSHNTRTRNNPHIQQRRTAIAQKSIIHTGPKIWQELSQQIKNLKTIQSFTREIKKNLVQNY